MTPQAWCEQVQNLLTTHANPSKALPMSRYMKNHFPFLGIPTSVRSGLVKPWLIAAKPQAAPDWLLATAAELWDLPQREFQYTAIDLLGRYVGQLQPKNLIAIETLLLQKSWWDSIDSMVGQVVGPMVAKHPNLLELMDAYSQHPNFWLRRVALLHQLGYKHRTDRQRLFGYCAANASHPEFFVRKAIGWALRTYARVAPQEVQAFVQAHPQLSALSKKEALKHLGAT